MRQMHTTQRSLLFVGVTLLVVRSTFAAAPHREGEPRWIDPRAAPVVLATGPDSGVDGYLEIEVDEYGSWGDFGGVGLSDGFNPNGPGGVLPVAFTSGNYLFVPARGQKELLTTIPEWLAVLVDDPATSISITSPNVPGDMNGDGVDDNATSAFTMTGGGTDLSVSVTQVLTSLPGGGVAQLVQTYSITNNEASTVELEMVHNFDGDLLFDGDFTSDEVGTTSNDAGIGPYVFMQEVGDRNTAVTVSGAGTSYYGGKLGILPGGVPPAYGFGTDVQIYDTGSLPGNWANHIAGVGYDTDGASGAQPAGCDIGTGCDGFVGLSFDVTIAAGETEDVVLTHTYGNNEPNGDCVFLLATDRQTAVAGDVVTASVYLQHNRRETVIVPFRFWLEDGDGDAVVTRTLPRMTFETGDQLRRSVEFVVPESLPAGNYILRIGVEDMEQGIAWDSQPLRIVTPETHPLP